MFVFIAITLISCETSYIEFNSVFDNYQGEISVSGTSPVIKSYAGLKVVSPGSSSVQCDAFFNLEISLNSSTSPSYALVEIVHDTSNERVRYWVDESFTEKVWLRFGQGKYTLSIYKGSIERDPDSNEPASKVYYLPAAYKYNITNMREEDGRFIYPSFEIQAADTNIARSAMEIALKCSTVDEAIRRIHDYVIKYLSYDFDSTIEGNRKKQDAISVMNSKIAVCEGYTNFFNALLRSIGIQAAYVTGTVPGGLHAWSYVLFEKGWSYVDSTWDDPIVNGTNDYGNGSNISYSYFNKSILSEHTDEFISSSRNPGILSYQHDDFRFSIKSEKE